MFYASLTKTCLFGLLLLSLLACGDTNKNDTSAGKTDTEASAENTEKDSVNETPTEPVVPTIKIGAQEWMVADINNTTYNNGDAVQEATSDKQWIDFATSKTGCFRRAKNGSILYNGFALTDPRGLVPVGFSIPTYADFKALFKQLGGGSSTCGKAAVAMATYPLGEEAFTDEEGLTWVDVKSDNRSGFTAKPGGYVYDWGTISEGACSYWWTSSKEGNNQIVVDIGYCSQDGGGGRSVAPLTFGHAIRAIKK